MYALVLEMPGDCNDFYQRFRNLVSVSDEKEKLVDVWNGLDRTGMFCDGVELRIYNGENYIDFCIEEVQVI